MVEELREFKAKILELLKEDEEFRYAVAGLIGMEQILERLDRNEKEMVKLWEEIVKLREDMNKGFTRYEEQIVKIWGEIARIWEEIVKLREDMNKGFARYEEEIAKLREEMYKGFARHDEQIAKIWEEIARLREDMVKGFARHDEELKKLREEMSEGFKSIERRLNALGARWGLMAEESFREGVRALIEREFGWRVERWAKFDSEGVAFGRPAMVEIDVALSDGKVILIEIKSHVDVNDVYAFSGKARFYEKVEGRKPDRLIIVTPYAEEEAVNVAREEKIEVYTGV